MKPFYVEVMLDYPGVPFLAPVGLDTPLARAAGLTVQGGQVTHWTEQTTGQLMACVVPENGQLTLTYSFDAVPGDYPPAVFDVIPSRYTRAAESLLSEVSGIGDTPLEIARAVAERFDYGHPERRFYDGHDNDLPALGCDRATGSCVDINLYFLVALRAARITAGYVVGAFFPAEKGDWCSDMHCWVVTRSDNGLQEWDIAHHLKMGRRDINPGLNPKPGFRTALSHGVALHGPDGSGMGGAVIKILASPVAALPPHGPLPVKSIRLVHPDIEPGPLRPPV